MSVDISPNFGSLPSAEQSLYVPSTAQDIATQAGGVYLNSTSMTRGAGNNVWGVDTNGFWMGAADFADAPFKIDYSGQQTIKNVNSGYTSFFNSQVLGFSDDAGNWAIIIGDPTQLPTL